MIPKIAQLLLFGVLPYLAVTFTTPDYASTDDTAAIQEQGEPDLVADNDDVSDPSDKA